VRESSPVGDIARSLSSKGERTLGRLACVRARCTRMFSLVLVSLLNLANDYICQVASKGT